MCRITGFWDFGYQKNYHLEQTLTAMRDSLHHGGPDSGGNYIDNQVPLGLGHRRLSILDLSEAGNQPMLWEQYVLVFNGEIYNFEHIRLELEQLGHTFQTGTDSEVILKAFKAWGIEMVQRFRGMFVFVIWDTQEQKLTICRDRVGVKPLFWYWKDNLFMFASELKAFHHHPKFDKSINPTALSLYLQQGYIHYPHCIFKYANKLEAGSFLELNLNQEIVIQKYWDVNEIYQQTAVSNASESELLEQLEGVLTESFELRMVADVPVGAFLSGGIDSSTVVALLQKQKNRQLKTFTIGFEDKEYNEAQHAKAVAQHLETEHHEWYCTESDFERVIPLLPDLYDEPFGDSSAIPTYLVAQMAKKEVKVSLSADGGDEIFGGYTKYEISKNFYPKISKIPYCFRQGLQAIGNLIDPLWLEQHNHKLPVLKNYKNISNKYPKLLHALGAKDAVNFFHSSSTYIPPKEQKKLLQTYQYRYQTNSTIKENQLVSFLGMIDTDTYLEGDIMTKVDRATMHNALEGRDPFLDHKIIEFGMQLPDHLKIKGGETKYLLRQLLFKHVPRELIERPKQGFSIPIQKWLLSSLQPQLIAIKEDTAFQQTMGLQSEQLCIIIDNFIQQKKYINPHFIWFLYCLHQWYLRWMK